MISLALIALFGQSQQMMQTKGSLSGVDLIRKMKAAIHASLPLTGKVVSRNAGNSFAEFKAFGPGYLSLVSHSEGRVVLEKHRYGKVFYDYVPDSGKCFKSDSENPFTPAELMLIGFESAFSSLDIYAEAKNARATTFDRRKVYAIDVVTPEQAGPIHDTIYLDRTTYLPVGFVQNRTRSIYEDVVVKANLSKADFDWRPPKSVEVETLNWQPVKSKKGAAGHAASSPS